MDKLLHTRDDGIDLAFERTKAWSKYCKEILSYVQRRLAIENEHARSVQKLCDQTRAAISEVRRQMGINKSFRVFFLIRSIQMYILEKHLAMFLSQYFKLVWVIFL